MAFVKELETLINVLTDPSGRQDAIEVLLQVSDNYPDLGWLLWQSPGVIAALLQDIISIYPVLSSPNLSEEASKRACNALSLLQCVASHPVTKMLFLDAFIHEYLYLILNTTIVTRPFPDLRHSCLRVLGALVKVDDAKVIIILLQTQIVHVCLNNMSKDLGSEHSKLAATYIICKILSQEVGVNLICAALDLFQAICCVLKSMLVALYQQRKPLFPLLRYIIYCYLRLSGNPSACELLKFWLPEMLKDATIGNFLGDDMEAKHWLKELLYNVYWKNRVLAGGLVNMPLG